MIVLFLVCGSLEHRISDPRLQASYFLARDNKFVLRKKAKKEKLRRKLSQWLRNGIWLFFFFQYDVVVCQAAERISKKLLLPDTRNCLGESYFCHPPLPTKRGEKNACLGGYCFSQSHRRSKIIKIFPLHGFGMLNLVPRVFSFSGMPVPERPLETRVGEYFVTTRTVPWTSYRKVFRVCKPRRVYFIQFNFYSWAIRGILETWSCQSTKVREKKWKKKKKPTEFCLPFFVVLL